MDINRYLASKYEEDEKLKKLQEQKARELALSSIWGENVFPTMEIKPIKEESPEKEELEYQKLLDEKLKNRKTREQIEELIKQKRFQKLREE